MLSNNTTKSISVLKKNNFERNIALGIAFVIGLLVTLTLHLIIQYIIQKKRLHEENQYYLMRVLSIIDFTVAFISGVIVVCSLNKIISPKALFVFLSLMLNVGLSFSLTTTLIMAIDRWIAIMYCLRYHEIVSSTKVNVLLITSGALNVILLGPLFYSKEVSSTKVNPNLYTNMSVLIYHIIVRMFTSMVLIVLGKMTVYQRNQNETKIAKKVNLNSRETEKLERTRNLKRSIKDVFHLNIWTCIFLLPMIISGSLMVFNSSLISTLFYINTFTTATYYFSNPIIYLTSFSKIRKYWLPIFIRNNHVDNIRQ